MRSRSQHGAAAILLLEKAEGEARAAAAADFGVPENLVAAKVLIACARRMICEAFNVPDHGPRYPEDAR